MEDKNFIDKINHIISLKVVEINKRLNMYFGTSEPFIGYYDINSDFNDGIIVKLKISNRELNDKFLKNLSENANDDIKEEKENLLIFYKKMKALDKKFRMIIIWNTVFDKMNNSFITVENLQYAKCSISSEIGIVSKIKIIEKENPDSEELKKLIKFEKFKKLYNVNEVETSMYDFIDNEIEQIIKQHLTEDKLEIDTIINQVVKEAIEEIRESIKKIKDGSPENKN